MRNTEHFNQLIRLALQKRASEEQYQELLKLLREDRHGHLMAKLDEITDLHRSTGTGEQDPAKWEPLIREIFAADKEDGDRTIVPVRRTPFLRRSFLKYAAVVLAVCGACAYFYFQSQRVPVADTAGPVMRENGTGTGNKAMLTLADGSVIVLDSLPNGEVVLQNGVKVTKKADGQLVYELPDKKLDRGNKVFYNTMQTPRGGQYQLTLPDGTRVWINAASSITYPTIFTENERNVKIEGEVYFEVAKNKTKPFIVDVLGAKIEVLGTHFNVNAYADERSVKATLLEGSIRIRKGPDSEVLGPGEQANIEDDRLGVTRTVDLGAVMAWKNGTFQFEGTDVPAVCRQLSRWYDVDVVYTNGIPSNRINGEMGRHLSLPQVVVVLNGLGLQCELKGKRLLVSAR